MKKIIDNIISRELSLKNIKVTEVIEKSNSEDNTFNMKAKYKIVENNNGEVNIRLNIISGFEPEIIFNSEIDFNLYVKFEKDVEDKDISDNIGDLINQVGSEVSALLAQITRSMIGTAIIVPPMISKITKSKEK